MRNAELSSQLQALSSLFDKAKDLREGDIELLSHWAKYLCILSAGFLENALTEVYVAFSATAASPQVASFARASLSRIQNPNAERFYQVTSSFKQSWGDDLTVFLEDNGRKEAINAIMANRHKIAHGKKSDISYDRLRKYFDRSVEVIEFIEGQCR